MTNSQAVFDSSSAVADDHPHDECGVFALYDAAGHAASDAAVGLHALQNRGQEAAGIAASNGENLRFLHGLGLVEQALEPERVQELNGTLAIGHVRYSTAGTSSIEHAQPIREQTSLGEIGFAHNGNLTNSSELRERLEERNIGLGAKTDSELAALSIGSDPSPEIAKRIRNFMRYAEGAYSVVMITPEAIFAWRDPYGFRPLLLGERGGRIVAAASETSAFDKLGISLVREVERGEIVRIDAAGFESLGQISEVKKVRPAPCVFEDIYISNSISTDANRESFAVKRMRLGQELAKEALVEADVVVGVPMTGIAIAEGYADESGIPERHALYKHSTAQRTFIHPDSTARAEKVRQKLSVIPEFIRDKRIIVIDDSLVRGTTMPEVVKYLREAGPKEVHVRIASPPVKHPCYQGVDLARYDELIASNKEVEEILSHIGADSLAYLSVEGMYRALNVTKGSVCDACFTGDYPLVVKDQKRMAGPPPTEPDGQDPVVA